MRSCKLFNFGTRRVVTLASFTLLAGTLASGASAALPTHPDQLTFKPFPFEPPAAKDHRVNLGEGMVAYLVPDRSTPLVTITVMMRLGTEQDPVGKEGLADMTLHLLTRSGTANRTAKEMEDRVGFLGAELSSGLGGGGGFFGPGLAPNAPHALINLLSKDVDEGLTLLVECLKTPSWESERLKLRKDELMQAMKTRNDQSQDIEAREWGFLIYGEKHWSNRYTTKASVEAITPEDLAAFHRRYVGPKNFLLAVSGDFSRDAMVKKLKQAFAKWPHPGEPAPFPSAPTETAARGWFLVDKDVNQGRVSFGLPAIDRYDPDYFSATMMNLCLGGGGFTSRLVTRIRSDEGLAYSVRSSFEGGTYHPGPWRVMFQSKVRSVAYAIEVAMAEIDKIRKEGVSEDELRVSKNLFIESFPAFFETPTTIANTLATEELTGRYERDPKYLAEFRNRVAKVTVADVQQVANRLLDPSKMTVLMVGNANDILLGDPKHQAQVKTMAGGEPARLPLRDPLTMKPIPSP